MKRMRQTVESTPPPFARGIQVEVTEENIRPWTGTVRALKFSMVSGWWAEVVDERGTWVIPARYVTPVPPER